MARRWLKIGAGAAAGVTSILGLFIFLTTTYGFIITDLTGNFSCEGTYDNPCVSEFTVKNPTPYDVDIYSKDQVKLDFAPNIKDYALFTKDGRCKAGGACDCTLLDNSSIGFDGWRCVDFTNATKPRSDKVYTFRFPRYSTKNFLLAGIKNNPSDEVKWGFGAADGYLDPIWGSVNSDNMANMIFSDTDGHVLSLIKWNITDIPAGQTIDSAELCLYIFGAVSETGGLINNISTWRINNQTWDEDTPLLLNDSTQFTNATNTTISSLIMSTTTCFDVSIFVREDYNLGNPYSSFRFESTNYPFNIIDGGEPLLAIGQIPPGDQNWMLFEDRAGSHGTGNYPVLNITYSDILTNFDLTYLNGETTTIYNDNNGTKDGTESNYTDLTIQLSSGNSSGNFTSSVFDFGSTSEFFNISWTNGGNYSGELPNNQETENIIGGANMTGNTILLHLNGDANDYSGNGRDFGENASYTTNSKFGSHAASFNGIDEYLDLSYLIPATSTTISAWINSGELTTTRTSIFDKNYGVYNFQVVNASFVGDPNPGEYLWYQVFNATGGISGKLSYPITCNEWHHVAGNVDFGGNMSMYVDGQMVNTTDISDLTITYGANVRTTIGSTFWGATQFFNGTIDEFSFWNRSLGSDEIQNIYERGILEMNLSVRSCDDSVCSGEPWNQTTSISPYDLDVIDNQYFQYKFDFLTDDIDFTPKLYNVSIYYNESIPTSSCVYGGSGDFNVDCSEECTISSDYDIYGDAIFTGLGTIGLSSKLNFISSNQEIIINQGCFISLESGGSFG